MAPPSSMQALEGKQEGTRQRNEMRAILHLTCFKCSLISSCFRPQGKVGPIYRVCYRVSVSWLIRADRNSPPHKCRLHHWFNSNVKHFGFTFSPMRTIKEGDTANFFIQDLGLAPVAKTCPHRPQVIKKSINSTTRFRRKNILKYIRIYKVLFSIFCPFRDLTSEGSFFLFPRWIYLVVCTYSTYVNVHKRLEEECRVINESGSCTLRPPRLLPCCFPLHRR